MGQEHLSPQQFKRPLGGPNGVEDRLRARTEYEQRTGWVDRNGEGAAMALINDPREPHLQGFTPRHWGDPDVPGAGRVDTGYWHRNRR